MRLAVLGAGAVGRAVASLAGDVGHDVVALADSRGAAVDSEGVDVPAALDRKAAGEAVGTAAVEDALAADYDALVEATPTTLGDAEPGFSHARAALERDRHVVLANKGPVAERYGDLRAAERESEGRVRFEATVGAAIPVVSTVEDLGPARVSSVRGVLNGTANFVLSRMDAAAVSYDHALGEAQDLGIAEADPAFDVNGTDAALKCVILANVLRDGRVDGDVATADDSSSGNRGADGASALADAAPAEDDHVADEFEALTLDDASVSGISDVPRSALELASENDRTVRLVGEVTPAAVRVAPRLVPRGDALAVDGTRNVVEVVASHAGSLTLAGAGAGGAETASAVFADLRRLS